MELITPYQDLSKNSSSKKNVCCTDGGRSCCGECFDLDGRYAWHTATLSLFYKTLCTAASMSSAQVMYCGNQLAF